MRTKEPEIDWVLSPKNSNKILIQRHLLFTTGDQCGVAQMADQTRRVRTGVHDDWAITETDLTHALQQADTVYQPTRTGTTTSRWSSH
jgi:hypothetical protein